MKIINNVEEKCIPYKKAIQEIIKLVAPYSAAQLIVMVGELSSIYIFAIVGNEQLAATGNISIVQSILFTAGTSVLLSECAVAGEMKKDITDKKCLPPAMGMIYRQGMVLAGLISGLLLLTTPFIKDILILVHQPENLAQIAQNFFYARAWGIPFMLGLMINQQFILGVHKSSFPVTLLVISNAVLSTILGYCLTLGALGLPKLDEQGLGYAYSGSYFLHFVLSGLYLKFNKDFTHFTLFQPNFRGGLLKLKQLATQGCWISLQVCLEGFGLGIAGIYVGKLGQNALAAQQAVAPYLWLFIVPALASAEIMGGLISRSPILNIKRYSNVAITLSVVFSSIGSIIFFTCQTPLANVFLDANDPNTSTILAMTQSLFMVQGAALTADSLRNVMIGILRGLQDSAFPSSVALFSTAVEIGLGYVFCFSLDYGLNGVYFARNLGIGLSALILSGHYIRKKIGQETHTEIKSKPLPFFSRLMCFLCFNYKEKDLQILKQPLISSKTESAHSAHNLQQAEHAFTSSSRHSFYPAYQYGSLLTAYPVSRSRLPSHRSLSARLWYASSIWSMPADDSPISEVQSSSDKSFMEQSFHGSFINETLVDVDEENEDDQKTSRSKCIVL